MILCSFPPLEIIILTISVATLFLEYWKRYNARLSFKWGTTEYSESEQARPDYRGELTHGTRFIPCCTSCEI